jgi:glycosyltransferase involved in cell wall biosynthesis
MEHMVRANISIIVPTRNRAASLRRFLSGLEKVAVPDGVILEVLIVDNDSSDETAAVLRAAEERRWIVRGLFEARRGQSAAINCGLKESKGDLICLMDDDVVIDKQWAANILRSYAETDFEAIQGRVLPGVDPLGKPADPALLYQYNIPVVDYGDEFLKIRGLTGAHMTFKRKVFEKVGYFDVRLGPGAAGFSGDTEFSARIGKAGFKMGYTPHAIVRHELDPSRFGRRYNRMVEYRKGLSRGVYRRESIALKVIPNLLANCFRYCLYAVIRDQKRIFKTEGRIMKCLGYLMAKFPRLSKSAALRSSKQELQ